MVAKKSGWYKKSQLATLHALFSLITAEGFARLAEHVYHGDIGFSNTSEVSIRADASVAAKELLDAWNETMFDMGTGQQFEDFMDFALMAQQIQLICDHDHDLANQLLSNDTIKGFMDEHSDDHHDHDHGHTDKSAKDSSKKITSKAKGRGTASSGSTGAREKARSNSFNFVNFFAGKPFFSSKSPKKASSFKFLSIEF